MPSLPRLLLPGRVCLLLLLVLGAIPAVAAPGGRSPGNRRAVHPQRRSSAARAPAGEIVAVEKAALEIPNLKNLESAAAVTVALQGVKGVKSAIVDLNTRLAVVDYNPRVTEIPQFLRACRQVGFDANEYRVESRFPKPIKLKGG